MGSTTTELWCLGHERPAYRPDGGGFPSCGHPDGACNVNLKREHCEECWRNGTNDTHWFMTDGTERFLVGGHSNALHKAHEIGAATMETSCCGKITRLTPTSEPSEARFGFQGQEGVI